MGSSPSSVRLSWLLPEGEAPRGFTVRYMQHPTEDLAAVALNNYMVGGAGTEGGTKLNRTCLFNL